MSEFSRQDHTPEVLAQKFYRSSTTPGSWSDCVKHIHKAYKEQKSKPVPPVLKSSLDGPSVSWKILRRLIQAISYADSYTKDCMIFSYEERNPDSTGQRLFLVTHPHHMWLNHKSRVPEERCTYEVIREGSPCKLYFDLEFKRGLNASKDGNKMTTIFIKCVIAQMLDEFNLKCSEANFLWLDASTEVKYSCHLVLQLGGVAFQDNIHAGYFVSLLTANIKLRIHTDERETCLWPSASELKQLFVVNKDGNEVIFCDEGVYTKNRNFRMYLSTKYRQNAPLTLSHHNQYAPEMGTNQKDPNEIIFYDSLVTFFRKGKKFSRLLSFPQNVCTNNRMQNTSSKTATRTTTTSPSGPSPYPEVDNFVLSLVKDGVAVGFIRKWSFLETEGIIVYEVGNYRFCFNVGRHHKSNNIMIIVDMKKHIFYQKCHDPECRKQNFKSEARSLPSDIISLYAIPDDFFDTSCFTQMQHPAANQNDPKDNRQADADDFLSDDFLEDLSLDSYPFTQLGKPRDIQGNHEERNASDQLTSADNQMLDDLRMEDFDSEFTEELIKEGKLSSENSLNVSKSDPENSSKSNSDDMSVEDEMMMAEAAAAVERLLCLKRKPCFKNMWSCTELIM